MRRQQRVWRNKVGKGEARAGVIVVCGGRDGGNALPLSSHVDEGKGKGKGKGKDEDETARVG